MLPYGTVERAHEVHGPNCKSCWGELPSSKFRDENWSLELGTWNLERLVHIESDDWHAPVQSSFQRAPPGLIFAAAVRNGFGNQRLKRLDN